MCKYLNGFEKNSIYKQPLPYLAKELFLKESKALIIFITNKNLFQLS